MDNEYDFGPGDVVSVMGAFDSAVGCRVPDGFTGMWTVVGVAGDDLMLAKGALRCGGVWHPEWCDVYLHPSRCIRVSS